MTADDTRGYSTVADEARAEYAVKGSRFLGHAAPAATVDAARAFIDAVRAAHADATHNVPAYRVRAEPVTEWASDDGEPSGTAGRPVLNVLQQRDVVDVVVVVTRYYGGVKLGAGGLVRAYARAARDAVDAAGVVTRVPRVRVRVVAPYDDVGTVRRVLEDADAEFTLAYAERVTFTADVPVTGLAAFRDRVQGATRGRARVEDG